MSPTTSQKERKRKTRIPKSTYGFRVQPDSTQSPFSASQAESCGFESRHPLHKKNVQSLVNQGFFLFVINWKMSHLALLGDSWGTNGDRIFPVWPPSLCSRASSRGHRSRRSFGIDYDEAAPGRPSIQHQLRSATWLPCAEDRAIRYISS